MDTETLLGEATEMIPAVMRLSRMLLSRNESRSDLAITPTQMHVLLLLHGEERMRMSQLSDSLQMQRQQMTRIVEALVQRGFVARAQDPDNRRHVLVHLSDEGREALQRIFRTQREQLQQLLALLNEEQQQKFLDALHTIRTLLGELL